MLFRSEKQLWAVFLLSSKRFAFGRLTKLVLGCSILLVFPVGAVQATSHIAQFVFITDPQTVQPGALSKELTIQARDEGGNPVEAQETIDLEFISSSASGEFLNSSGSPASTVMNKNWKTRTFYYRDSAAGVHDLKVKATRRGSEKLWEATQKISVSAGDAASPPPLAPPPTAEPVSSPEPPSSPPQLNPPPALSGAEASSSALSQTASSSAVPGLSMTAVSLPESAPNPISSGSVTAESAEDSTPISSPASLSSKVADKTAGERHRSTPQQPSTSSVSGVGEFAAAAQPAQKSGNVFFVAALIWSAAASLVFLILKHYAPFIPE